jgi:hypothetical protein
VALATRDVPVNVVLRHAAIKKRRKKKVKKKVMSCSTFKSRVSKE